LEGIESNFDDMGATNLEEAANWDVMPDKAGNNGWFEQNFGVDPIMNSATTMHNDKCAKQQTSSSCSQQQPAERSKPDIKR
jgi:hypothetical protein